MNIQSEPFNWVKERHACSIEAVFERLKLGVQSDVEERQKLRERGEFGFESSFTFTPTIDRFSASVRTHDSGRAVVFCLRRNRNHIVILDDNNKEMMSATVTLTDDRECRIVVGLEIIEEWQFRKRALEFLFFGEVGESS